MSMEGNYKVCVCAYLHVLDERRLTESHMKGNHSAAGFSSLIFPTYCTPRSPLQTSSWAECDVSILSICGYGGPFPYVLLHWISSQSITSFFLPSSVNLFVHHLYLFCSAYLPWECILLFSFYHFFFFNHWSNSYCFTHWFMLYSFGTQSGTFLHFRG